MNQTPLVSIIVPVYNTERFLVCCLDSICNQSYVNIEVIVVNDGSTDSSGLVIKKFENSDSRVIGINKTNGGLSSARNVGLKKARGKYLVFVDSDDFLQQDSLLENVNLMEANPQIDMLVMPCDMVDEDQKLIHPGYFSFKENVFLNYDKMFSDKFFCGIPFLVCGRIFKTQVFQDLRFSEGRIYEDTWIAPQISDRVKGIMTSAYGKYNYTQRIGSIINTAINVERFSMKLDALRRLYNYCYFECSTSIGRNAVVDEIKMVRICIDDLKPIGFKSAYVLLILRFLKNAPVSRFANPFILKYLLGFVFRRVSRSFRFCFHQK